MTDLVTLISTLTPAVKALVELAHDRGRRGEPPPTIDEITLSLHAHALAAVNRSEEWLRTHPEG